MGSHFLSSPFCFLFLTAWQNSSLKTLYPLFLVSSAADGCYSAKLACYTELSNKSAFFLSAMAQTKEVSRKEVEIGSKEKLWRTQGCFSYSWAPSLSDVVRCISGGKKRIKIPSMPFCLYLSLYTLPSKWWLCAKDVYFHESLEGTVSNAG